MTIAVQWSPGDVDAWTRAFAADHAQRAGLSIRDWLEQFIARETALAGADAMESAPPQSAAPLEASDPPKSRANPADAAGLLEPGDPTPAWAPARDAFGQRTARPEPAANAAEPPTSDTAAAAEPEAIGVGDDGSIEAHFGARARVAGLWDLAHPRPELEDDDIELLLRGPTARLEPPETLQLDEVETALRQVREEVQAAVPHAAARAATPPDGAAPALGQASADAIAQLGVDIARLVEVVDCGFERLEAVGAKQAADLHSDVAQMLDQLASRFEHADSPTAAPEGEAEGEAEPPAAPAVDEALAPPAPGAAPNDRDIEPPATRGALDEPNAEPPPTVASDAVPPVVAADDTGAAQADDSDADPRRTAGWDDDELFDDPADLVPAASAAPFGRAVARTDGRGDVAPALTAAARCETEASWTDRGGWSEATAADFERHMETSAAAPADDNVSGGTDLQDAPTEAEPAAANPDKGFSWLRFPGGGLLRKRVA